MSFGITTTISTKEGLEAVEALYNGAVNELKVRMAGKPSKLQVGDYVYTIYEDKIYGRLKIKYLLADATNPEMDRAQTLIVAEAPGERLRNPIPKKSHGGVQYYEGDEWPRRRR